VGGAGEAGANPAGGGGGGAGAGGGWIMLAYEEDAGEVTPASCCTFFGGACGDGGAGGGGGDPGMDGSDGSDGYLVDCNLGANTVAVS